MHTNSKHWCPVCDAGWVEPITLMQGTHAGMLCGECEAFWPQGSAVNSATFIQFSHWLRENNIATDAMELVRTPR